MYKLSARAAAAERGWSGGRGVVRSEARSVSLENPSVPLSEANFVNTFGGGASDLPAVTIDNSLEVPAVWAAVSFLSRTLASIPLHVVDKQGERVDPDLEAVIGEFWNDEQSAFKALAVFWQQVFTGGRGLAWIERFGGKVVNLWPMDPGATTIRRERGRLVYAFGGQVYPSREVIDVPFMLKANGINHYGPINKARRSIQLSLAMNEYGSRFFAGGGVPPLALSGPLPSGADAMKRAMEDIWRAIDAARASEKPIIPMPPNYKLEQIGYDPAKGQMTDARRFQIEEIARAYQLPPVFLQDLSRATFSNAEQQDLHLVKHLVGQWAQALESELNLKVFGRKRGSNYIRHNLDGLLRGDFKTRADAVARLVQSAIYTPNTAAGYMGQPKSKDPAADRLYMQGATVPLGESPAALSENNPE